MSKEDERIVTVRTTDASLDYGPWQKGKNLTDLLLDLKKDGNLISVSVEGEKSGQS